MAASVSITGKSGDLFGDTPIPLQHAKPKRDFVPELKNARVLCRELRHKRARPEKQRIAHLICLNLLSMLRQRAHSAR